MSTIAFAIGWLLDIIFGDPVRLPHPIVYFGKAISFFEHRLNKGPWRRLKGAVTATGLISATYAAFFLLNHFIKPFPYLYIPVCAICVFYCLAGKTLIQEVRWVFEALDRSLDEGRKQVARIVGRDTSELSAQEVRKAALETLAENLSDGVIAPMFWFAILGFPGMMAYKMVNTLDSMIGYHSERYVRFGTIAARIDDIANYIPARLTALLMITVELRPQLLRFVWHYGDKHASPNSGYPESALAGILNCRFGGPHYYFGEYFPKPYIGDNERELNTTDMKRATAVNRKSEILMAIIVILLSLAPLSINAQETYGTQKDMPVFYEQMKSLLTFPWAWQNKREMEFGDWKKQAREKVFETMQIAPPAPTEHSFDVVASEKRDGYTAKKISFYVNAWEKTYAYLLIPDKAKKNAAILLLHDHGAHFSIGKEKMVRPLSVDSARMADADEWAGKCYDGQYFGDLLAQHGYVVLATDALFWGERGRMEGVRYDSQQALAANMMQMGGSWGAYITWDDIRSAEFLASLPFVDKKRIGCCGFSMGSYRSWMTSALTDVISASASICWMNDTEHLMSLSNNQNKGGSAYSMLVPALRQLMDYPDVAALACPKPALFFNGERDKLMPVAGVDNCYHRMHEVWSSQNADSNLITRLWPEKHFFNKAMQTEVISFFDTMLRR